MTVSVFEELPEITDPEVKEYTFVKLESLINSFPSSVRVINELIDVLMLSTVTLSILTLVNTFVLALLGSVMSTNPFSILLKTQLFTVTLVES